jgi:GTPase involved in cell partitioning and DNA repair
MVIAIKEKDEEINNLHNINKELLAYIDRLEEKHNLLNQAKDISQVAKKSRTLFCLEPKLLSGL